MPRNNFQKAVFGIIMSYSMAFGMEIYNTAINLGLSLQPGGMSHLTWSALGGAMKEMVLMGVIVIVLSETFGNRLGARFMETHSSNQDSPYIRQLLRQAGTIAVMCPSMSMVATILFYIVAQHQPVSQLPVIWLGTVLKNFPMAFFWNMFAAAPFTHWLFELLFRERRVPTAVPESTR